MSALAIRELSSADFESFSKLVLEIYSENPKATKFSSEPTMEELKALLEKKVALLKRKKIVDYVAVENGKVIGECDIYIGEKSTIGLIVAKGARRKGIGKALLEKSLERAKELGSRSVIAEVHEGNKQALDFFRSNGFVDVGKENDVLLLERAL